MNLRGVLNTDGAAEGGLNMIWLFCGDSFDSRKEELGGMFNRCLARRYDCSFCREEVLNANIHGFDFVTALITGRRSRLESIVAVLDLQCT